MFKKLPYRVIIEGDQAENGYKVTVGCKTFFFNDPHKMVGELVVYLTDPKEAVKRYESDPQICLDRMRLSHPEYFLTAEDPQEMLTRTALQTIKFRRYPGVTDVA